MRTRSGLWLWWLAWFCTPLGVRAEAGMHTYALVVGSNRGGDGQGELAYAVQDATRVAALLSELGRTPRENIEQLEEPSARDVEQALNRLRLRLAKHASAGERAQLLFYYSGHARATALTLGEEELSLEALRAALLALPSTLTVVVLDACQSGAFSGVKGAAPAADFSVQSVQDLDSTGIAVMASSSGSELSQESSELGSGYFTHHLLVALRGAGDRDRNGRVSLDEAYAYAYQHTLSDTARTQVGSQHATLETALTGRGDVPLSYPVDADAQLALSGAIAGRVMVQQADRGAVLVELVKAEGPPLLLALPSGRYEVLVRGEQSARSCEVTLTRGAVHSLQPAQCKEVALAAHDAKSGARLDDEVARESWFLEAGFSLGRPFQDDYTRRLDALGYDAFDGLTAGLELSLGLRLSPHLALVARYGKIDDLQLARYSTGDSYEWRTHALTLGLRARWPLLDRWLVPWVEADAGVGFTTSMLAWRSRVPFSGASESSTSMALRGLVGFDVAFSRYFGCFFAAGYGWSPALHNDLGDRRLSGAWTVMHGLRVHGVRGAW